MKSNLAEVGAQSLFDSIDKTSGSIIFSDLSLVESEAARNLVLPLLLDPDGHPGGLTEAVKWMNHLVEPHLAALPSVLRPVVGVCRETLLSGDEEIRAALELFLVTRLTALGPKTLPKERYSSVAAASSNLFVKSSKALGLGPRKK